MSHFAEIKPNGTVVRVLTAEAGVINSGILGDPHKFIQTSYNGKFRNKFAAVGDVYDRTNDVFLPPKPYASWIIEKYEEGELPKAKWKAPVDKPKTKSKKPSMFGKKKLRNGWKNNIVEFY